MVEPEAPLLAILEYTVTAFPVGTVKRRSLAVFVATPPEVSTPIVPEEPMLEVGPDLSSPPLTMLSTSVAAAKERLKAPAMLRLLNRVPPATRVPAAVSFAFETAPVERMVPLLIVWSYKPKAALPMAPTPSVAE